MNIFIFFQQQKEEDSEIVLTRMNLFTVEMRRGKLGSAMMYVSIIHISGTVVEGQGFGLHIAEGYTQTSKGLEVQGVFVRDIVPGSPADNCGRQVLVCVVITLYMNQSQHDTILRNCMQNYAKV